MCVYLNHKDVFDVGTWTILLFIIQLMSTSEFVIVKHYQYITWPWLWGTWVCLSIYDTEQTSDELLECKDKGPILVHCSAGVGRTGTFIAVDMALEQAEKERKVDIAGIVNRLREQRMKMVQTDVSWSFVLFQNVNLGPAVLINRLSMPSFMMLY